MPRTFGVSQLCARAEQVGLAYEYATPPFKFDPLMSVQYYSLASQAGEPEADMALSKWFLCGAPGEGGFDKDEALAVVFAEKAARRGLASRKMIDHKEHEDVMEDKLVRKRTQARERAQASGAGVGGAGVSKYAPVAGAPPMRTRTPGCQPQAGGSSLAPPQLQPQPQAALPPIRPTQADAMGLARAASKSQNTGGYQAPRGGSGWALAEDLVRVPSLWGARRCPTPATRTRTPRRMRARRRSCTRPRAPLRSRGWDTTARSLIRTSVLLCEVSRGHSSSSFLFFFAVSILDSLRFRWGSSVPLLLLILFSP